MLTSPVGTCGVASQAQPAGSAQWPRSCMALTLHVNPQGLSGLTAAEFLAVADESCRNCSAVSGLSIRRVASSDDADISLSAERMQGSVLAYAFFPNNRCGTQLSTRFNSRVVWSRGLFLDTLTHELGHCFGLPHTNDRRDIMYPSIVQGRDLDGKYGPHYSIPQLVDRYGGSPLPPPPPPPNEGWLQVLLKILLQVIASLPPEFWTQLVKTLLELFQSNPAAGLAVQDAIKQAVADQSVRFSD